MPFSENKEPVQNSIIDINGRNDIEPEGENIMSECDDVHNSENICETFTQGIKITSNLQFIKLTFQLIFLLLQ